MFMLCCVCCCCCIFLREHEESIDLVILLADPSSLIRSVHFAFRVLFVSSTISQLYCIFALVFDCLLLKLRLKFNFARDFST